MEMLAFAEKENKKLLERKKLNKLEKFKSNIETIFYFIFYLFILSLMLTITEKILFTIKIAVKC